MKKSFEEARELGAINAALMIVRKLVESNPPEKQDLSSVEVCARHSQLVARRAKLSSVQSHRIALAAWLSALENKEGVVRQLATEHGLDEVLFPQGDSAEQQVLEAHILAMVKAYQALKQQGAAGATPAEARNALAKVLPKTKGQKRLLRLFAKVLEDEVFLGGGHAGAGRVLVVDPEEATSPVLAPPLISDGYEVRVVGDAQSARNCFAEFDPHLLIIEKAMPLEDGLSCCRSLKDDAATAAVPVLMVTSSKGTKVEVSCLKAGAEAVLTRPVDLELLFLRVGRLVKVPDEAGGGAGGVSGSLEDMAFSDIIQIVTAGGRSMEIELKRDEETGVVWIQNGEIIHSAVGDIEGEVAFYRMMRWQHGSFSTQLCESFDKQTIRGTVMGLLMEGARRDDEGLLPDGSS